MFRQGIFKSFILRCDEFEVQMELPPNDSLKERFYTGTVLDGKAEGYGRSIGKMNGKEYSAQGFYTNNVMKSGTLTFKEETRTGEFNKDGKLNGRGLIERSDTDGKITVNFGNFKAGGYEGPNPEMKDNEREAFRKQIENSKSRY